MIYETLLAVGVLGLLAQAVLGMAHGHDGHHGHVGNHAAHADHGHAGGGHAHQGGHHEAGEGAWHLASLFSPLTIFSLCVGAGATGLLMRPYLVPVAVAAAALVGAGAFYGLVVRPLWTLLFQFASRPSRALEGAVTSSAEALTRFDAQGQGMVRIILDGQIVRLLAHLESDEVADRIRPGDRLVVTSVDGHTNTCRVARL